MAQQDTQQPLPQAVGTEARLTQARTEVIAEMGRTDAKASALLTVLSLPLAVLIAAVPGRHLPVAAAVLACIGALALAAAMALVLLIVRPRLGGNTTGSYLHWANCTPEEVTADVAVDRSAERVAVLSRIAASKFRALRLAIDITAGSLVLLALALTAALTLA
ncbi:Pycsar system effector family protein [Streptomyces sp. NPDC088748]|uniref:Pycsar system effector family protein n=1 Tax=Streptomyces sp. NPDC088748 TaxID=3365887 RepID=UPI00381C3527